MKDLDDCSYLKFCTRQNLNKALTTLAGIIDGIAIDGQIDANELAELRNWCDEQAEHRNFHPFTELYPLIDECLSDGIIDPEELENIRWFLKRALTDHPFYDSATGELQRLQALLHGMLADFEITETEATGLADWMHEHEYLARCYPFDEIYSLLITMLRDRKLEPNEAKFLRAFFAGFVTLSTNSQIKLTNLIDTKVSIHAICAIDPAIFFPGRVFTFTGFSIKGNRKDFAARVEEAGGVFNNNVTKDIDYLVYGSGGNPCWTYSCFGRKVEMVTNLRKAGSKALVIHENDFWDAYANVS